MAETRGTKRVLIACWAETFLGREIIHTIHQIRGGPRAGEVKHEIVQACEVAPHVVVLCRLAATVNAEAVRAMGEGAR